VRLYYITIGYVFLFISVMTFVISLLISVIAVIDVVFKAGFGYPSWAVFVLAPLVVLGYFLIKLTLWNLKKWRDT
jgi:phosphoglycerol transferase MdoB-like AlkP superfamily enzyme